MTSHIVTVRLPASTVGAIRHIARRVAAAHADKGSEDACIGMCTIALALMCESLYKSRKTHIPIPEAVFEDLFNHFKGGITSVIPRTIDADTRVVLTLYNYEWLVVGTKLYALLGGGFVNADQVAPDVIHSTVLFAHTELRINGNCQ